MLVRDERFAKKLAHFPVDLSRPEIIVVQKNLEPSRCFFVVIRQRGNDLRRRFWSWPRWRQGKRAKNFPSRVCADGDQDRHRQKKNCAPEQFHYRQRFLDFARNDKWLACCVFLCRFLLILLCSCAARPRHGEHAVVAPYLGLTRVAFREHDSLRGSIQGGEKFWNEPAFDGAGFTR